MIKKHYLFLVLLVLYFFLTVFKLMYPGLQYDEMLFGSAAVGLETNFITLQFKGIPILLLPYIGALKAWIYYPLFKVFGVSVYSVRLPIIILGGFSLLIYYQSLTKIFNKTIALLTLSLLIIEPGFIMLHRADVGPNGIEFFLKSALFYCIVEYILTKSYKILLISGFLFLVGVFNKANFVWYFVGLGFVWLYYQLKSNKKFVLKDLYSKEFLFFSVTFIFIFIYTTFLSRRHGVSATKTMGFLFFKEKPFTQILGSLSGTFDFISGDLKNDPRSMIYYFYPLPVSYSKVILGLILISLFGLYFFKKIKYINIFWLFILIIFLQYTVIGAERPWHYFSVFPYLQIIFGVSLYTFFEKYKTNTLLKIGILSVFFVPKLFIQGSYLNAYGNQNSTSIIWSSAIYDLIEYSKNSPSKFMMMDWGMASQVSTFLREKDKIVDTGFLHNSREGGKFLLKEWSKKRSIEFVMRADTLDGYTSAYWGQREILKTIVKENNRKLVKIKEFWEKNRLCYLVFRADSIK